LRREHHKARKVRRQEGSIVRAKQRLDEMADPFVDSDDEDYRFAVEKNPAPFRSRGMGGLCQLSTEEEDFGEEFASYAASLRRVHRRLERWDSHTGSDLGVIRTTRKPSTRQVSFDESPEPPNSRYEKSDDGTDREMSVEPQIRTNGDANGDVVMEDAEDLDDMEKELLGMADGGDDDDKDDDEELDDVDKTLLGLDDSDASEE
jgi:Ino eighty subunit 1